VLASKTLIVISSVTFLLAGCAVPRAARESAGVMSAYTAGVQRSMQVFSDSRLAIDRARLQNISELESAAVDTSQRSKLELDVWGMKGVIESDHDARVVLFESVRTQATRVAEERDELTRLMLERRKEIDEMTSALEFDLSAIGKAAKALATLATPPDREAQFFFLLGFARETREALDKLEAAAKKEAEAAKQEADAAKQEADAAKADGAKTEQPPK
jgi:hypothetical protein